MASFLHAAYIEELEYNEWKRLIWRNYMMLIRKYEKEYETGWLRCRILSFLDTAYFDNVLKEKEIYQNPAIELVAIIEGQVVGLIDVEYEREEKTVCTSDEGLGGMIWHIAVHPDFQRKGIGQKLLLAAEKFAKEIGLHYLEAWTRDDKWVNAWYVKSGFVNRSSYLHVLMEDGELNHLKSDIPNLNPVQAWAHYTGEDKEKIKGKFKRVHACFSYTKML